MFLKIYRREEKRIKSRWRRGLSKFDSLGMLWRGEEHSLVLPCSETQENKGHIERKGKKKSLIVNPKQTSNLNPSLQAKNSILWLSDTACSSLYLLVLMAQHPQRLIYQSLSLTLSRLPPSNSRAMAWGVLQVLP